MRRIDAFEVYNNLKLKHPVVHDITQGLPRCVVVYFTDKGLCLPDKPKRKKVGKINLYDHDSYNTARWTARETWLADLTNYQAACKAVVDDAISEVVADMAVDYQAVPVNREAPYQNDRFCEFHLALNADEIKTHLKGYTVDVGVFNGGASATVAATFKSGSKNESLNDEDIEGILEQLEQIEDDLVDEFNIQIESHEDWENEGDSVWVADFHLV